MVPDEDYLRKEEAGEKDRLAKKVAALSDSDRQKIVARGELVAVLTCAVLPPCRGPPSWGGNQRPPRFGHLSRRPPWAPRP